MPSSIVTGIETSTAFLHFSRTLIRFGSIPNVCPTLRSCWRASSSGFSRRCVGASAVDIAVSFSRGRGGVYVAAQRIRKVTVSASAGPSGGTATTRSR